MCAISWRNRHSYQFGDQKSEPIFKSRNIASRYHQDFTSHKALRVVNQFVNAYVIR